MNNANLLQAAHGPLMMITLGILLAIDHFGSYSFGRTWPLLVIVFGVLKLAGRAVTLPRRILQRRRRETEQQKAVPEDGSSNPARISDHLAITIPKTASLVAVGRYGDFDVSDVSGSVDITSDNAGVRLQNIGGDVRVDTRRSDIVRAVNVKGSVELKGSGTDLELQDIGWPVTAAAGYGGTIQFRNLAKPLHYESEHAEFTAEAIPGQVRMSLSDLNATNVTGPDPAERAVKGRDHR